MAALEVLIAYSHGFTLPDSFFPSVAEEGTRASVRTGKTARDGARRSTQTRSAEIAVILHLSVEVTNRRPQHHFLRETWYPSNSCRAFIHFQVVTCLPPTLCHRELELEREKKRQLEQELERERERARTLEIRKRREEEKAAVIKIPQVKSVLVFSLDLSFPRAHTNEQSSSVWDDDDDDDGDVFPTSAKVITCKTADYVCACGVEQFKYRCIIPLQGGK